MRLNLIKPLLLIITAATLAGCATHKDELLPHGGRTMQDIWYHEGGEGGSGQVARRQLLDVRQSLRRPLTEADVHAAPMEQASYTRTAANEIQQIGRASCRERVCQSV